MSIFRINPRSLFLGLGSALVIVSTGIQPSLSQTTANYSQVFSQTSQLALTPDQQEQLEQIAQDTQAQILGILTPEQQQQLQLSLQSGQSLRDSVPSLGLSTAQRGQLQTTLQSTLPQIQEILTPEQMAQLQSQRGGFRRRGF